MMSQPGASLGPNPKSFGHPGAGGSLGYADPEAKIGFGYTMNKMQASLLIDPRATALIDAVYASYGLNVEPAVGSTPPWGRGDPCARYCERKMRDFVPVTKV